MTTTSISADAGVGLGRALALLGYVALGSSSISIGFACAHLADPEVTAHINVAPGVTARQLGRVAIPTFEIEGSVRDDRGDRVVRREHLDTMDVTRTFSARLISTDLVILDRQFVDQRLDELGSGSSLRVSDDTAPAFGKELGAQTLIIGRYRFDCSGEVTTSGSGAFVRPDVVHRQSLQLRGFELETGRVIFDVELALDATDSSGRLLPKSLARAAADRLWARLDQAPEPKP